MNARVARGAEDALSAALARCFRADSGNVSCDVLCEFDIEEGPQHVHRLGTRAVVHPDAPLLPIQDSRVVQHLQVVAEGGLRQVETFGQIAHGAGFTTLVGNHQGHESQSDRVGERLQDAREIARSRGRHGLARQRRATTGQPVPGGFVR